MTGDASASYPLRLILFRPDGSEAARRDGVSPLRLEYSATEAETKMIGGNLVKWKIKILNNAAAEQREATGRLRIGIPLTSRTLEDTQFRLLGAGKAQEIPVQLSVAGRVVIEAEWQTDQLNAELSPLPLTLSLIHPGQDRILGRRTGRSLLRSEQQISDSDLERGRRVVIRLQNDNAAKVRGRVKAIFTPGL